MTPPTIGAASWQVTLGDYAEALAVAPDAGLVAAGSLAGDAVVLDVATGELVAKLDEHPFGVSALAWSPDGSTLAVGGHDATVRLYDRAGQPGGTLSVGGWVAALAWRPDGTSLAVAAGRNVTLVHPDGVEVVRYEPLASTVTALSWSPNGMRLGATAYGGIAWYDPDTAPTVTTPKRTFTWKGSLLSLAVAPNGRWACAGSQDASIHLWPLWSGDDLSMSGYPAKIEHLAFRPDSAWMASACLGEITLWDFTGRGPAGRRPAQGDAHARHVTALAWQPSVSAGKALLASADAAGRIALWPSPRRRGETLQPVTTADPAPADRGGVATLAWASPDALVVAHADGAVEHRPVRATG